MLLGAFVLVESRSREPMLPLRLFRDRSFSGAQIAAFAISASFFAIFLYTTLYLQQILGLSAIEAGLVYLPGTITMLFVSGATSALGAKVSARLMVAGGLALVSAGMVLFTLAGVGSSWAIVLPGAMVALIGTGLFNPALTAVALGTVPMEQSGVAAGVNDTFRQAGIAVGVAALGALIPAEAAFGGGSPQEYVDGLHAALWAGAGARRGRRRRRLVPDLPRVRRRRADALGGGAAAGPGGRRRARARGGLSRSWLAGHRPPGRWPADTAVRQVPGGR